MPGTMLSWKCSLLRWICARSWSPHWTAAPSMTGTSSLMVPCQKAGKHSRGCVYLVPWWPLPRWTLSRSSPVGRSCWLLGRWTWPPPPWSRWTLTGSTGGGSLLLGHLVPGQVWAVKSKILGRYLLAPSLPWAWRSSWTRWTQGGIYF